MAEGRRASKPPHEALPFRRERILCVGILAFLAPIPLAFSFSLEPWVLAVFLAATASLLWSVRRGRIPVLGSLWLNLAGLAYLFFFYFDLRHGSRSLLRAVVHLLLFTMVLKLASIRRESDFSMALVLTAMLFLGSMATSVHYSLIPWVVVYAGVAWPSLVRWALWRDLAAAPDEWRRDRAAAGLPGLKPTVLSVGASVLLAVPFFVLLPRLKTPFVTGLEASRELVSGFSETVDPDHYGTLKQDNRVFMRLSLGRRMSASEADRLYLRGLAFTRYDGRTWRRFEGSGEALRRDDAGWFPLLAAQGPGPLATIDLSPLGSRYVPFPSGAVALRLPEDTFRTSRAWNLDRDPLGNVRLPVEPDRLLTYEARLLSRPAPDLLAPARGDPSTRAMNSERIRGFLTEATRGLDPASSPEAYAFRVAAFLSSRYAYTLDSVRAGQNPVEEFLFQRKAGQCETFATAMAVALREVGIPTRFVTGFSGGELGFFGNYVIVRGRDAHAWVEAWCGPEKGWLLFDPTPPSGRPALEEVAWSGRLRQLTDGVGYYFDRFILSFRQGDQLELLRTVRDAAVAAWDVTSRALAAAVGLLRSSWAASLGALLAGVGLLALALRLVRGRLGALWGSRRRLSPGSVAYRRLQGVLRRAGAKLGPASAPGETLEAASRLGGAARPARFIVEAYVSESFGGRPLDALEVRRLQLLLAEVRRAVSERRAA